MLCLWGKYLSFSGRVIVMSEAIFKNQVIQKAWEDPSFKQKLLANPKEALREALGIHLPDNITLTTVEEGSNEFYLVIPPSPASGIMKTDVSPLSSW
ncbi:Nitrile hydratase, alpha chain [compost metagenome]